MPVNRDMQAMADNMSRSLYADNPDAPRPGLWDRIKSKWRRVQDAWEILTGKADIS